jgi:hypothetical protein
MVAHQFFTVNGLFSLLKTELALYNTTARKKKITLNTIAVVQYNHASGLLVLFVESCADVVKQSNAKSREGAMYLNVFLMIQDCFIEFT